MRTRPIGRECSAGGRLGWVAFPGSHLRTFLVAGLLSAASGSFAAEPVPFTALFRCGPPGVANDWEWQRIEGAKGIETVPAGASAPLLRLEFEPLSKSLPDGAVCWDLPLTVPKGASPLPSDLAVDFDVPTGRLRLSTATLRVDVSLRPENQGGNASDSAPADVTVAITSGTQVRTHSIPARRYKRLGVVTFDPASAEKLASDLALLQYVHPELAAVLEESDSAIAAAFTARHIPAELRALYSDLFRALLSLRASHRGAAPVWIRFDVPSGRSPGRLELSSGGSLEVDAPSVAVSCVRADGCSFLFRGR